MSRFLFLVLVFCSCKKTAFYDDYCTGECYIIAGTVLDDSTGMPLENVELTYRVPNKWITVATTHTDTAGHYKMSFDSNFNGKFEKGKLYFGLWGYVEKTREVPLDASDVGVEKIVDVALFPAGHVRIIATVSDKHSKRLKFEYHDGTNTRYETVSETLPDVITFEASLEANRPNIIELYREVKKFPLEYWEIHPVFPMTVSPDIGATDTIYVEF